MCSWTVLVTPTTKAIIRESARLVNLTLGRAGFFICSAGSYAEGDLWNRWASPSECVPRYPELKGRGSICYANLHPSKPLTSVFFGLFRLRRRNKKLSVFRSAVSVSIPRKPLFRVPYPNHERFDGEVALSCLQCLC